MPLTPADVHNVVFKKPPIGKRGYDDDEVDAFLDEVERELVRLIEENNELKAQLEHAGAPGAPVSAGDGDVRRFGAENAELKAQLDRMHQENQRAEQAMAQAQQGRGEWGRSARTRQTARTLVSSRLCGCLCWPSAPRTTMSLMPAAMPISCWRRRVLMLKICPARRVVKLRRSSWMRDSAIKR